MKINSINPSTGKINKTFTLFTTKKALDISKAVKDSYPAWRDLSVKRRCEYLRKLAEVLKEKKADYGCIMSLEMGKPISQAIAEVEKCAWTAEFFAEKAEAWLKDEPIDLDGRHAFISFEPIGEVLAVMPWNFPFWQALRCAIPAMAVGNVVLLRHSNVVPMCALAIEEAFKLAGFPKNVFRTILSDHEAVAELIKSKYIDGVSVTGSVDVGKTIAKLAGENIKKCVLELGGSDPFIVLDDADIELTCKGAVEGRLVNSGQSCVCAKRFIVVSKRSSEFVKRFSELMQASNIGDPLDKNTSVGPLANEQQLLTIEAQVNDAKKKGAKIECGGKRLGTKGFFFEPTVITNVNKTMRIFNEEVFGPVATVFIAKDEEDAIKIANSSDLGLGGSVWTKDLKRGEEVARRIESGMVFVNQIVKSDPRVPFGGTKQSGIGKELSRYGLLEFTNKKSIVLS